jgi:hypothetical protein
MEALYLQVEALTDENELLRGLLADRPTPGDDAYALLVIERRHSRNMYLLLEKIRKATGQLTWYDAYSKIIACLRQTTEMTVPIVERKD